MSMRARELLEQRAAIWLDQDVEIRRLDDDEEWQTVATTKGRLRATQQLARESEVVDQALSMKAWEIFLLADAAVESTDRLRFGGVRELEVQGVDDRYEGPYLKVQALEVR
jgi:hypothetical protein